MNQNAVIVYMSCKRDVPLLIRSLILLSKNFKYCKDYPIVVFHDDIDAMTQSQIRVSLHSEVGFIPNISFEILKFEMPSHVSSDPSRYSVSLQEFWMGYRHMCRFHSGGIYTDPRLLKYDWYWRLDSDSYLLAPIDYDPFDHMAKNGYEYAYMCDEDKDLERVTDGLWDATVEFMNKNNITMPNALSSRLVDGKWECNNYYTNFEISKFSFWRGEQYMNYFKHLDETGDIYYKRWGDAPIHWLAVKMLMDESKVWAVKDIAYQHNNWVKNLNVYPDKVMPESVLKYIDGNDTQGRRGRVLYAMNRYRQTGIDGCNWGD